MQDGATRRRAERGVVPLVLGLVCVALAARVLLLDQVMPGGGQPVGPDATDWVVSLRQHLDLPPIGKAHRYPLVPWVGALLARLGAAPVEALILVQAVASSLLAGVVLLVGRSLWDLRVGAAAGLFVAVAPLALDLGLSTSPYGTFPLWTTLVAGGLLGAFGRAGPWLAGLGALLAAATLHQGLLLCLAAAPAGLLARRYRAAAATVAGAGLGVGLAFLLDPGLEEPVVWMLAETAEYLGGNVAEETAREGGSYAAGLAWWLDQLWLGTVPLLVGSVGLIAELGTGLGSPGTRRRTLALAWLVAPALPLALLLASPHHLLHLLPLVALAGAAGVVGLLDRLPDIPRRVVGAGLVGALAVALVPQVGGVWVDLRRQADGRAADARELAAFFEAQDTSVAVVVTGAWPGRAPALVDAGWAAPTGRALVPIMGVSPTRQATLAQWLVGQADPVGLYATEAEVRPGDRGSVRVTPTGAAAAVDGRPDLWVAPVEITAPATPPPPP